MAERAFKNDFENYTEGTKIFDESTGKLLDHIGKPLVENVIRLLGTLEKYLATDCDWEDYTVYSGTTGIALMYMRFLDSDIAKEILSERDFAKDAMSYIEPSISKLKRKRYSFLNGCAGPLAVAAALFQKKGLTIEADDLSRRCDNLYEDVCESDLSDDLLNGRAGYLYTLLFMEKHLPPEDYRKLAIKEVAQSILASGQRLGKKFANTRKIPLYFDFNNKVFVGTAHGMAGIIYMLLQAHPYLSANQLDTLIRPSVDELVELQMPSGNFPASLGTHETCDKLVHWCHGAAGIVYTLLHAYEVLEENREKYLQAAIKACDRIWEVGLLRKGYGLCHGVAGNGYAFLYLFQVTRDTKHLYRACKFGEWCFEYGKHGCRIPDRPLSLFEGLSGTIHYLLDLLDPLNASFPAYQLG